MYLDGIAKIEEGGLVHYSDFTYEVLKNVLGIDMPTWNVKDSYEVATMLIKKYREFAKKYGVTYD